MRVFKKIIISLTLALFMSQGLLIPLSLNNNFKVKTNFVPVANASAPSTGTGVTPPTFSTTLPPSTPATAPTTNYCNLLNPLDFNLFKCLAEAFVNIFVDLGKGAVLAASSFMIGGVKEAMNFSGGMTSNPLFMTSLKDTWVYFRNIVMGLLSLAIVIIAIMNILNIQRDKYGLGKMIPHLVITIFMTMFSYAIASFLLDFFNALETLIMTELRIGNLYSTSSIWTPFDSLGTGLGGHAASFLSGVGGFFVALVSAILILVIGAGLILLVLTRVFFIYLLIAISPLAFMANLLPFTQSFYTKWWSEYFKWLLMGIEISIILFIGSRIVAAATPSTFTMSVMMLVASFGMAFAVPLKGNNAVTSAIGGALKKAGGGMAKWATAPITDRWGGITSSRALARDRAKRARSAGMQKFTMGDGRSNRSKLGRVLMGAGQVRDSEGHLVDNKGMLANLEATQIKAHEEQHEGKGVDELLAEARKNNISDSEVVALLRLIHKENPAAMKGEQNAGLREKMLMHANTQGMASIIKDYSQDIYLDDAYEDIKIDSKGRSIEQTRTNIEKVAFKEIKEKPIAKLTEKEAKIIVKGLERGVADATGVMETANNYLSDATNQVEYNSNRTPERDAAIAYLAKSKVGEKPVFNAGAYNGVGNVRL